MSQRLRAYWFWKVLGRQAYRVETWALSLDPERPGGGALTALQFFIHTQVGWLAFTLCKLSRRRRGVFVDPWERCSECGLRLLEHRVTTDGVCLEGRER